MPQCNTLLCIFNLNSEITCLLVTSYSHGEILDIYDVGRTFKEDITKTEGNMNDSFPFLSYSEAKRKGSLNDNKTITL